MNANFSIGDVVKLRVDKTEYDLFGNDLPGAREEILIKEGDVGIVSYIPTRFLAEVEFDSGCVYFVYLVDIYHTQRE